MRLRAVLAVSIAVVVSSAVSQTPREPRQVVREIAVTIDDLPTAGADSSLALRQWITAHIVGTLASRHVPATGFVIGAKLMAGERLDSSAVSLLQQWLDAGLDLGNHTFSHPSLHAVTLREYEQNILDGEKALQGVIEPEGKKLRYFRHPFLQTGRSVAVRDSVLDFLRGHGYRVAPVTVDNSDWIFAKAYTVARDRKDTLLQRRIKEAYIPYLESKLVYFERESAALFEREIRQVMLLHANVLNATMLPDVLEMMRGRGYRFVSLDQALEDPAYASTDTFTGGGGISWLHRWAITQKKPKAYFEGEPVVPAFVMETAGVTQE